MSARWKQILAVTCITPKTYSYRIRAMSRTCVVPHLSNPASLRLVKFTLFALFLLFALTRAAGLAQTTGQTTPSQ